MQAPMQSLPPAASRRYPASQVLFASMIAGLLACAPSTDGRVTGASRLLSIDSIPLVDIGDEADGPHAEFSGYILPALLSDGRIIVANGGSQELRIFDSTGAWLQTIGRAGAGPGEFSSLGWLHVGVGDTLRTYDWSLLRVSVFSPGGVYQRGVMMGTDGGGGSLRPVGVLANGALVASTQKSVDMHSVAGVRRDTVMLILYDADRRLLDSLGHFPGSEAWISRTERSVSVQNRPFGKELIVIGRGASIYIGTADAPELTVLRPDGSIERVIRWSAPTRSVTPEIIDAYIAATVAEATQDHEDRRAGLTAMLKTAPYPNEIPAYAAILLANDGSIWVGQYLPEGQGERQTFNVFDGSGAPLGSVELPPRFTPSQVTSDRIIGIWRDNDDVPHIRVHRLVRAP